MTSHYDRIIPYMPGGLVRPRYGGILHPDTDVAPRNPRADWNALVESAGLSFQKVARAAIRMRIEAASLGTSMREAFGGYLADELRCKYRHNRREHNRAKLHAHRRARGFRKAVNA